MIHLYCRHGICQTSEIQNWIADDKRLPPQGWQPEVTRPPDHLLGPFCKRRQKAPHRDTIAHNMHLPPVVTTLPIPFTLWLYIDLHVLTCQVEKVSQTALRMHCDV